jgi:hypothetical protein
MNVASHKLERLGMVLILMIALLMFITPLVRLRGPGGELQGDGYHVRGGISQLQSMLAVVSAANFSGETDTPATPDSSLLSSNSSTVDLPFSVKIAAIIPWLIYLAMACAALALLDMVTIRRAFATLSLIGGGSAAISVLHIMLMSSDLQAWATQLLNSRFMNANENVIVVTRLLMINSFVVEPGLGLMTLATFLLLVTFLVFTRAVPRINSVVRRESRIQVSQPVRIRPLHPNFPVDTCTSVDLSRSGLLLESSSSSYYVGMEVFVNRNPRQDDLDGSEEHGSVVRIEKLPTGKCRIAICIFSSEAQDVRISRADVAEGNHDSSRHPLEIHGSSR